MERRRQRNYSLWLAAGLLLLVLLSVQSVRSNFFSSVALEQAPRCGAEEHCHNSDCYSAGKLNCKQNAHIHNRNCYLLLLADNDINKLLDRVEGEENHSLETMICRTVEEACADESVSTQKLSADANESVPTPEAPPLPADSSSGEVVALPEKPVKPSEASSELAVSVQEVDIAVLNTVISKNEKQTGVVLNENLYNALAFATGPSDTVVLLNTVLSPGGTGGVSTLSVGDEPQTNTYKANIYMHLDGTWQCIGTLTFEVTDNGGYYYKKYIARINQNNVVNLVNDSMGSSLKKSDMTLLFATSESASSWTNTSTSGNYWVFKSDYSQEDTAKQAKYVRVVNSSNNPIKFYTVMYEYPNGSVDTVYVKSGDSVTLPNGYEWKSGNKTYSGGTRVTIGAKTTFTTVVQEPETGIRVSYNVNFPTSAGTFSNTVYMPDSPTLLGTTVTSIQDALEENSRTTLRDLSSREVWATTAHQASFRYVFLFDGWQTESGEVIDPNSNLDWNALQSYDANDDGTVQLSGKWLHSRATTINFCVRYDSKTGQSDTSSTKYTPSIYSTYVGGGGNLSLEGISDEEAFSVDQQIRTLYGNWAGDVWLYSFPSDEYIFEQLKNYTDRLTVEGEEVKAADLNSTQYAIRWYKIFLDGGDGWHMDGRLVKKKGQITVSKQFFGAADTLAQARNGFYITASNSTMSKQYVLTLDAATAAALTSQYRQATFLTESSGEWNIEGVERDEVWVIQEHPVTVPGNMYYAEYSVYDTDGEATAIADYGTTASLIGKTFALDEDPDQGLLVDFSNYYYPDESILIKKEDADTGQPIGNAVFELWQYNSEGVLQQLKFSYDAATGQYRYDNNGTVTRISTGDAGYSTVTTTGFSYGHGPVVAKEVISPGGYAAAPNVTLTEQGNTVSITGMAYEDGTVVQNDQWAEFAEVHEDGGVLIIKNHSTAVTSLTVNKVWADGIMADSVTIVLQANSSTATNLFPGLVNIRVELNAANGWRYTWTDLPTYANGAPVVWSVKEILVGSETTTADGVSFANWTVVYSQPTQTDADGDGIVDHWRYTVTNSVRRGQLYLLKTDTFGDALAGAEFKLVEVDRTGTVVSGAAVRTGTTGSDGLLHFDNMKYATRYRLEELNPPVGYEGYTVPAYLSIAVDGTVTVETHSHVTSGGAYMVRVVNHQPVDLPETGGSGDGWYIALGIAMMAAALSGLSRKRKRGRCAIG